MTGIKPRRMDFAARAAEHHLEKKRVRPWVLILILAVVLVAAAEGVLAMRVWGQIQPALDRVLAQMSGESLQADYARAQALEEELSGVRSRADGLTDAFAAADAYPEMDGGLLEQVRALAGPEVMLTGGGYAGIQGQLTLYGAAGDALAASAYAQRLRESGLFLGVRYYGYDSDESAFTVTTDGAEGEIQSGRLYEFAVICTMEGGGEA